MSPERIDALRAVFRAVFDLDAAAAVDGLAYRAIPAWDSIGHMRLVAELETAFDLMLDTDEVIGLSDFAKAVEIVSGHLDRG